MTRYDRRSPLTTPVSAAIVNNDQLPAYNALPHVAHQRHLSVPPSSTRRGRVAGREFPPDEELPPYSIIDESPRASTIASFSVQSSPAVPQGYTVPYPPSPPTPPHSRSRPTNNFVLDSTGRTSVASTSTASSRTTTSTAPSTTSLTSSMLRPLPPLPFSMPTHRRGVSADYPLSNVSGSFSLPSRTAPILVSATRALTREASSTSNRVQFDGNVTIHHIPARAPPPYPLGPKLDSDDDEEEIFRYEEDSVPAAPIPAAPIPATPFATRRNCTCGDPVCNPPPLRPACSCGRPDCVGGVFAKRNSSTRPPVPAAPVPRRQPVETQRRERSVGTVHMTRTVIAAPWTTTASVYTRSDSSCDSTYSDRDSGYSLT